ncbi:hypothetical protein GCM10023190_17980 [Enteractinococcus fodinae]|uniref:Membrane protein n=1 Tax=Enteractinococcus fodinae TaxID=684663 RepID=A0ABU2B4B6_9MICC|nr:DUF1648 domain-containing protein [Enteractinococcus fodinae]MDR7348442.1 putative membrane protein [Enteractinococcus fodinae]
MEDTSAHEPAHTYVEAIRRGVPFRDEEGVLHYPTKRSRPQPTFTLDTFHRFLLISSVVVAIGYTIWMIFRIPSMPDQLPMHFAADGSVNRYGSPWELLIPAALLLATILGCALLTRYPRIFNYGTGKTTENNIQTHYKNGVQLMVWMTFSATVLLIISLGGIAGDWAMTPAIWIGLGLFVIPILFFTLRMPKH